MNRRTLTRGLLALIACSLGGCVYSIHPLNQDVPTTVEAGLPGTWVTQDKDGSPRLATIRAVKHAYEVDWQDPDNGLTHRYEANLVRIQNSLFADLLLTDELKADGSHADVANGTVALHFFLRVSLQGDTLRLSLLDQDWVRNQLKDNKIVVAHEDLDEQTTILTAPPAALREFLRKIATTDGAFGEVTTFNRKK